MTEQYFNTNSILNEINTLKKEITCAICLDLYTEPINLTTCQHTFCSRCFKELFSNERSPKLVKCPLCNKFTNRRSFYVNNHIKSAVELFNMYKPLFSTLDKSNDINKFNKDRLQKFLDDCIMYKNKYEDVPENIIKSGNKNDENLIKTSKTFVNKRKSLNCTIVTGKYTQKRKKSRSENSNNTNSDNDKCNYNITDDNDTSQVCEENFEKKNKIIKMLEDDYLNSIYESNSDNNVSNNKIAQCIEKDELKKHELSVNKIAQCSDSNSSKKTSISGWSRMKSMKKQIKKKEVKYKQLNVSNEIKKTKLKSPQETNIKDVKLRNENSLVLLNRLDESITQKNDVLTAENNSKNSSLHIKTANVSDDKLELLRCLEGDKQQISGEEDIYSLCTQILQTNLVVNNTQKDDLDEIRICAEEIKKCRSSTPLKIVESIDDNEEREIVVEALVHHKADSIIVEKCSSLKRNNAELGKDIIETIPTSIEKLNETAKKTEKSQESTPQNKEYQITTRSSRDRSKRNITPEKTKISPKRKKINKQNTTENCNKKQNTKKTSKIVNTEDVDKDDLLRKQDLFKNKIKTISEQQAVVMSGLESSLKAVTVVISQCSSYMSSESLFSDTSWPIQNKKMADNATEFISKHNSPQKIQSTSLQTVSSVHFYNTAIPRLLNDNKNLNEISPVYFYNTAIPCLEKIENNCNQMISLSEEINIEQQKLQSKFNINDENDNKIISIQPKMTRTVEIQTEDIKCPKCSHIFNYELNQNSSSKFQEINEIEDINTSFSKEESHTSRVSETRNLKPKENSQNSSDSNLCPKKKVNRQLTFSDDSSISTVRSFKRNLSPSSVNNSKFKKFKIDNEIISVSDTTSSSSLPSCSNKILYKNDIDIFFQSESSEKMFSLSAKVADNKSVKKVFNKCGRRLTSNVENTQDNTYISVLEKEYKHVQFDSVKENHNALFDSLKVKDNFDTVPNTVLDNLLASIDISAFEDKIETSEKTTENEHENLSNKNSENSFPDILSATEREERIVDNNKTKSKKTVVINDNDKTKSIEEKVTNQTDQTEDKEVELINLMTEDNSSDNFEDVVESTPQKTIENRRDRSKFAESNLPVLLLEPPATLTESLHWVDIIPPPPPLEFQDSESMEKVNNISNILLETPEIFALNTLDKGFVTSNPFSTQNLHSQTKQSVKTHSFKSDIIISNKNIEDNRIEFRNITPDNKNLNMTTITGEKASSSESENIIPNTITQNERTDLKTSTSHIKKNLNPIVLAQKEKFSPLQIIVNSSQIPKSTILPVPKQQSSILSFVKSSQKENNHIEITKNISNTNQLKSSEPVQSVEVCESPEPEKDLVSKENKLSCGNRVSNTLPSQQLKHKLYITSSRLAKQEIVAIISLSQKLNIKYCRDFDKNITHLIVSVDDNNRIKDHTLKYVLGIANSIWVLSFAWIRDSLQQNKLLPEEAYEVLDVSGASGPKISRLTRLTNPLLKDYVIHCADPFISANKSDVENAIISLGGEIKKSAKNFVRQKGKYNLILSEAKATQDFEQFEKWRDTFNVIVVDIEWLSRTVGQYQIVSAIPFILCLDEGIHNFGYPYELIAPVPQSQITMTNTNI